LAGFSRFCLSAESASARSVTGFITNKPSDHHRQASRQLLFMDSREK
jgi:hypothetical protein